MGLVVVAGEVLRPDGVARVLLDGGYRCSRRVMSTVIEWCCRLQECGWIRIVLRIPSVHASTLSECALTSTRVRTRLVRVRVLLWVGMS